MDIASYQRAGVDVWRACVAAEEGEEEARGVSGRKTKTVWTDIKDSEHEDLLYSLKLFHSLQIVQPFLKHP